MTSERALSLLRACKNGLSEYTTCSVLATLPSAINFGMAVNAGTVEICSLFNTQTWMPVNLHGHQDSMAGSMHVVDG